jgi:hypothetical protein
MILYVVNATFKKDIRDEWLEWMRGIHIPEMLQTGYFTGAKIFSVILPAKSGDEVSCAVQYTADTYEKFMSYKVKEAKRMGKKVEEKFGSAVVLERYLMETIEE